MWSSMMTRRMRLTVVAVVALIATPAIATAQGSTKKGKKTKTEFLWIPHPSIRVGKNLRVDFRARYAAETNRSDAATTDQPGLDRARRRVGVEGEIMRAGGF